jgi:hypothetical protein
LESVSFDAADSGQLVGGFRYKPLLHPVTLIPGQYTITVQGFDGQNPVYKRPDISLLPPKLRSIAPPPPEAPVLLNTGGELIRFKGCSHYHVGYFLKRTRTALQVNALEQKPDLYAAATFVYSAATQYDSPFAADFAALTAGVTSFSWDTNKSSVYSYRYGSIAVLERNAFPVVAEPSGNRMVLEAASTYEAAGTLNGDPNGARCVAFADEQWAYARNDNRAALFENAIRWASRKTNPAEIVIGLSTNMDAGYFRDRGYQVVQLNGETEAAAGDSGRRFDVLVVDFREPCAEEFMARIAASTAQGSGLVATFSPWRGGASVSRTPLFDRINALLKPFGLAYRSAFTQLNDFGFTNIQANAYPPVLFSAFPASELLRNNRLGRVQLDSLEKALALHTMSYSADGQPELLSRLAAVYAGSTNSGDASSVVGQGEFVDVATLTGAQADTNWLGNWRPDGNDLVSAGSRGSVEYHFEVGSANIYRIQIYGAETLPPDAQPNYDLILSVDGVPLGHHSFQAPSDAGALLSLFAAKLGQQYSLQAPFGTSDKVECLTPFLPAGPHKLRVFWNNPSKFAELRLRRIQVQAPAGPDADGDGVNDWVKALVDFQSGLDLTNECLTSHVSPMCLEGRNPWPTLISADVAGAEHSGPDLMPLPGPNARWYVNVPLASRNDVTFHVAYQNGAKSEVRRIRWLPVNVLNGGSYTLRDGDSLLLVARPEGDLTADKGTMQFAIGTNLFTLSASAPMPYSFAAPRVAASTGNYGSGIVTIAGTYTSEAGVSQTGTITVRVVRNEFKNSPVCWVGQERDGS